MYKLPAVLLKSALQTIFLSLFCVSIGFTQKISFDSLQNHYQKYFRQVEAIEVISDARIEKEVRRIQNKGKVNSDELHFILQILAQEEKEFNLDHSIDIINSLLPLTQNELEYQAFLYLKLGNYHRKQNSTIKALDSFLKASGLLEKIGEKSTLAKTYRIIASINLNGFNNRVCIEYAEKGKALLLSGQTLSSSDSSVLLGLHAVAGVAHRRLGNFDQAIYNTDLSIDLASKMQDSARLGTNLGNRAAIFYEMGAYEKAKPLLWQDYNSSINSDRYLSAMNALLYLNWIYLELNQQDSLYSTFIKMETLYDNHVITNPKTVVEYLKLGAQIEEMKGNLEKSNAYLKEFIVHDARRDSANLSMNIADMQRNYLIQEEMNRLDLMEKNYGLQSTHLRLRTVILILIALAFLAALWYVFTLRNKNSKIDKLNELLEAKVSERTARLKEINKELDTYLYRASHDIRRPIRTLLGLNNIAQIHNDPGLMKQLFEKVHITALSMDKMLFKLQMAYELNNGHQVSLIKVKEVIDECLKDMTLEIKQTKSIVDVTVNSNATAVKANKELLRIALDNILENALVYQNGENQHIQIFTDTGDHFFYIHVKDRGFGIPEQYFGDLFKPYFKISNKTQGSGLGLFLAHKAISYLGGEITITSKVNSGSQFTIKIPLNPK